ncbi:MAG: acyl-CoA thioesterase [Candidatus Omnitrophica bacterium]|nr:acyl-CoA thioesterase [Candidatus Omnitrophota bacterium]
MRNQETDKPSIYRYEIQVVSEMLDGNQHVNNVVYVQWMQDAAVRHSKESGCTRATKEIGASWVARSHWIKYLRPAVLDDRIAVHTWVSNFRKASSLRKYKFVRINDQAVLAEGETDWVLVDGNTGKPRAIPASISEAFTLVPQEQESAIFG